MTGMKRYGRKRSSWKGWIGILACQGRIHARAAERPGSQLLLIAAQDQGGYLKNARPEGQTRRDGNENTAEEVILFMLLLRAFAGALNIAMAL